MWPYLHCQCYEIVQRQRQSIMFSVITWSSQHESAYGLVETPAHVNSEGASPLEHSIQLPFIFGFRFLFGFLSCFQIGRAKNAGSQSVPILHRFFTTQ